MTQTLHAHRCEKCAAKGEQVIWAHSETCRGKIAAHKCPKCGEVNWKKFLVEPGQLPQVRNAQGGINFETLLGYIMVFIGIGLLAYAGYLYYRDWREGKTDAGLPK